MCAMSGTESAGMGLGVEGTEVKQMQLTLLRKSWSGGECSGRHP